MRPSLRFTALVPALIAIALLLPAAPAAAQVTAICPATFQVLHDDRIGTFELPAGPYAITVRGGVSCSHASDLFKRFLEDFDGRLPKPWTLDLVAASFSRGTSADGFSVKRIQSPHGGGGGRHPIIGARCPGTFTVLHDDRIGRRWIPGGHYRITLLSRSGIDCAGAARLFARFLQDYDGVLPRPWVLDVPTGIFRRGASDVGFRIKPYSGTPTGGNGSGRHPSGAQLCPFPFNVLHDDRIGKLRLPKQQYRLTLLNRGNLTCQAAVSWFKRFLNDVDGVLPRPWKLNTQIATFTRGARNVGFRVKPIGLLKR